MDFGWPEAVIVIGCFTVGYLAAGLGTVRWAILVAAFVAVIAANRAEAADEFECALYARDQTRVDIALSLDGMTWTREAIRRHVYQQQEMCILAGGPVMLVGREKVREEAWLDDMLRIQHARAEDEAERISKLGTEPAGERPAGPEGWAEACGRMWRSFKPEDGTVVRPRSKGGHVRCPLVLINGEWGIPE